MLPPQEITFQAEKLAAYIKGAYNLKLAADHWFLSKDFLPDERKLILSVAMDMLGERL